MKTNNLISLLNKYKIVIPPIQRDYAQGRNIGKIPHIRERFLNDIKAVLEDDTLPTMELDFIYGYVEIDTINDNKIISIFKPLDGQQRLTTLFLLHWFASHKEGRVNISKDLLSKFSYATRSSSREFCKKLVGFSADFNSSKSIDKQIKNQPWFFTAWLNDPTILSMLVVIEAITTKFSTVANIWDKLTGNEPRITFHLLKMKDLGLPDDLYIKMNARGKELTDFEHFKSQFSEMLPSNYLEIFNEKIDKEWSDLFWNIFRDDKIKDVAREVDSGFLSFFWYITNLLIEKKNIEIDNDYWLYQIQKVYKDNEDNTKFLFDCLNLFEELEKSNDYFNLYFYVQAEDYDSGRTRLFFNDAKINLFRKCTRSYGYGDKSNSFRIGEQLFLYAFIVHKFNDSPAFDKRIRKLRNLIASSEDIKSEYLSVLYQKVYALIINGTIEPGKPFTSRQIEEEEEKEQFSTKHPELLDTINRLEDHTLLRGTISIFDLTPQISNLEEVFMQQFSSSSDYTEISRAMLTFGNYSQGYGKYIRLGHSTRSVWRELFTPNDYRKNFQNTKNVLTNYLFSFIQDDANENKTLIENYLLLFKNNELKLKNWIYYYIKYDTFNTWNGYKTKGFYYGYNYDALPYEVIMMFKLQFNGRHWDPFLLTINNLHDKCYLENYGNLLQFSVNNNILLIQNKNDHFIISAKEEDLNSIEYLNELIHKGLLEDNGLLRINQDENGLDLEDRIDKCVSFLNNLDQTNQES
jgi:hypothetical protein